MGDQDDARDKRIRTEILVDAYHESEQAIGWHIYLEETMDVTFEAR